MPLLGQKNLDTKSCWVPFSACAVTITPPLPLKSIIEENWGCICSTSAVLETSTYEKNQKNSSYPLEQIYDQQVRSQRKSKTRKQRTLYEWKSFCQYCLLSTYLAFLWHIIRKTSKPSHKSWRFNPFKTLTKTNILTVSKSLKINVTSLHFIFMFF